MGFFKKSSKQNYDILSGFAWHVCGTGGMFTMLGMLLLGAVIGNVATLALLPLGKDFVMEYGTMIAYPIMFIPAMIYAKRKSGMNQMFETGYAVDSNHFGACGGMLLALTCMLATLALAFDLDAVTAMMPKMPEMLEKMLSSMTQGKLWVDFLSVSIFAPFFEEWLCRGTILRGLLNYKRADGSQMKPAAAIAVSALFFAVIHMNPWQAVPAFAVGCLMGYLYYKTGSIKLTMLMHFTNNTLALAMGHVQSFEGCETWLDVLPAKMYWIIFVAAALLLVLFVRLISRIEIARPSGNSDEIPAESVSL